VVGCVNDTADQGWTESTTPPSKYDTADHEDTIPRGRRLHLKENSIEKVIRRHILLHSFYNNGTEYMGGYQMIISVASGVVDTQKS
jgi:hypothetical protein